MKRRGFYFKKRSSIWNRQNIKLKISILVLQFFIMISYSMYAGNSKFLNLIAIINQ